MGLPPLINLAVQLPILYDVEVADGGWYMGQSGRPRPGEKALRMGSQSGSSCWSRAKVRAGGGRSLSLVGPGVFSWLWSLVGFGVVLWAAMATARVLRGSSMIGVGSVAGWVS